MSEDFPKDGTTFVTEVVERATYRWTRYKPDGARQMGKPGRFQKMVWQGDFFKWENAEPQGYLVQGDVGPLQARDEEITRLRVALSDVINPLGNLKRLAEQKGTSLNGNAYSIANSLSFVQSIARAALNGGSDAP